MLRVMLTLMRLLMLAPMQDANTNAYAYADGAYADGAADGAAQLRLLYFVHRGCRRVGMSRRAVVDHPLSVWGFAPTDVFGFCAPAFPPRTRWR